MAGKSVGNLAVVVSGDSTGFSRTAAKVQAEAAAMARAVRRTTAGPSGGGLLGGLAKAGGLAALTGGMTAAVSAGSLAADGIGGLTSAAVQAGVSAVKMAADFKQASAQFEVMTGSARTARGLLSDIQELAIATPFGSADLTQQAKTLLGFGVATDNVIPVLSRLGDVASGSFDSLQRMGLQFGQVMSSGRFDKESFNVFAEAGADVSQFAKAAGTDLAGLFKQMELGKVGADVMVRGFNAMTSEGGRFFNMNARMSQEIGGQWQSLTEAADVLKTKVGLAFLEGFRPSELLTAASDRIAGLTGKASLLVPAFEKVRVGFDTALAAGKSFGTVVLDKLAAFAAPFAKAAEGAGKFEDVLFNIGIAAIRMTGKIVEGVDKVRAVIHGSLLKPLSEALKTFGPKDQQVRPQGFGERVGRGVLRRWTGAEALDWAKDQMSPVDRQQVEALQKAAGAAGNGLGLLADQLGKPVMSDFASQWEREFRATVAATRQGREAAEAEAKQARRIREQNAAKGLAISPAAESWFKDAVKPMAGGAYSDLMADTRLAREALRFNPGSRDAIDRALGAKAKDLLGLDNESNEVRFSGVATRQSQEVQSIVSAAIAGASAKNPMGRIEELLKQMRDQGVRDDQELRELGRNMRELNEKFTPGTWF